MKMDLKGKIQNRTAVISVIGMGYVGLPTAILFAEQGYKVVGVDADEAKVASINAGGPIYTELGMTGRLDRVLSEGQLRVTGYTEQAVTESDIVLITVPTPISENKEPDLSHVISASEAISKGLKGGHLIILESTTYPGTTEEVIQPILERTGLNAGQDFGLAYCPERYNPGDSEHTIDKVTRVLGAIDDFWASVAAQLYSTIIKERIIVVRNIRTAEAAKIVENIQRDLNIALVNEFAMIFEKMDIDVIEVLDAASSKWNFVKFRPGPGVGGHCLPVDPYYLTYKARELGYDPKLILAGRAINDHMAEHVVNLIVDGLNHAGKTVSGSKIAIIGLAYKSNTGDMRESPSKRVIEPLAMMKAIIFVHDPMVSGEDSSNDIGLEIAPIRECLTDADCLVHLVAHDSTAPHLELDSLVGLIKPDCVIVDTQYVYSPVEVESKGYIYRSIGRGKRN
jgi:nucleotide sugar dehydrogenase